MRMLLAAMAVLLAVGTAAACSGDAADGATIDPFAIEASVSTVPSPAKAGSPAELEAVFTGLTIPEVARMNFDVRVDGKPNLFDSVYEGDNRFTGTFTFPEKGSYVVYLHLYIRDLHITKMGRVEVE